MPEQLCSTCKFWKRYTLPRDSWLGKCNNLDHKKEIYPDRNYGFILATGEKEGCNFWTKID